MPWKEGNRMDERLKFVARRLDGEKMSVLCREFGISRKTGYKIFNRYKDFGLRGLEDRARSPYRHPNKLFFTTHDTPTRKLDMNISWLFQRFKGSGAEVERTKDKVARKVSTAFSCVIDHDPRFAFQAARLLLSLRWFGGNLSEAPFFLLSIGKLPAEAEEFFIRHGAILRFCDPFDPSQPNITSNKLRGLEPAELEVFEHVVLIDGDIIVARDPSNHLSVGGVGLKLADVPSVKDELLLKIFEALNVKVPDRSFDYELASDKTFGYFNSGVVIIERSWRKQFHQVWSDYCQKLLELKDSLSIPPHFIEQSALAATVAKLDMPLQILPNSMNFPVHFPVNRYPEWYHDVDPYLVHYHWLSNDDGLIKALPLNRANLRAEAFNSRLRSELKSLEPAQSPDLKSVSLSPNAKPKIVVGSGWWCDESPHEWAIGADETRETGFFNLWLRQVENYLKPDRIVITDSHSPLKPDWQSHPNIHWIELDKNYGSPNHVRTGLVNIKFSGFTKSVLNGAMYALCCDADFFVYVEQDCLIRGENILRHAIGESNAEIFLGQRTQGGQGIEGTPAAPMIQQSLIVVKKSGLERFIAKTMEGPETDGELSPEVKMDRDLKPYDFIKIPFGRSRPIDFSLSHYYAQHLLPEELDRFLESEDLDPSFIEPKEKLIFEI